MPPAIFPLSALEKLPITQRVIAQQALKGSIPALKKLLFFSSPETCSSLLAIVYHLLSPELIASRLRTTADESLVKVAQAIFNLASACHPGIDLSAAKALWPRLWCYILAIEHFADSSGDLVQSSAILQNICGPMLVCVLPTARLVKRSGMLTDPAITPGIARLTGRLWAELIQAKLTDSQHVRRRAESLGAVYELLELLHSVFAVADEIIAGIETAHLQTDFSKLIIDAIGAYVPAVTGQIREDSEYVELLGLIALVDALAIPPPGTPPTTYATALAHYGLQETLTRLIASPVRLPVTVLPACLFTLAGILTAVDTWTYLPRVIDAGLLGVLKWVTVDEPREQPELSTLCAQRILTLCFPTALVFHPVIRALQQQKNIFDALGDKEPDPRSQPELTCYWWSLFKLAKGQVELLEAYESKEFVERRMCGNPTCGRIAPTASFRRCSACVGNFYCDKKCQKASWVHDHRSYGCELANTMRLRNRGPTSPFHAKHSETFLRLNLRHSYESFKLDILILTLEWINLRLPGRPLIVFNYIEGLGTCIIRLVPLHSNSVLNAVSELEDRELDELFRSRSSFTVSAPSPDDAYVLGLHHIAVKERDRTFHFDWVLCSQRAAFVRKRLEEIRDKIQGLEGVQMNNLQESAPQIYDELVQLSGEELDEVYR
ncbi:hypothetical protein MIND_01113000 [Mycena indigotica]|uniref:MYND-type domain-containing protein n=1 Tax=Mycena indigotica TaxID=2126181 RepID=A0A8H6VVP9_9AGAR|nr:uncharacterized protein MIND_01113000 [Mycena indigotica]KAF7295724.1 hypothetical protein MIND_01113000 [Mycena indigotica]